MKEEVGSRKGEKLGGRKEENDNVEGTEIEGRKGGGGRKCGGRRKEKWRGGMGGGERKL